MFDPRMLKKQSRNGVLYISTYGFPKIGGFPQIIPFLIGFSIIFTIHFGFSTPYFWFNIHMFAFYLLQHHWATMTGARADDAGETRANL